jgi:ribosomal protein L37AE/L43A
MLTRKRKYKCNRCGKIVTRMSNKKWIQSDCDEYNNGKYTGTYKSRLILITKPTHY